MEDTTTLFPNLNHDSIINMYTSDATKFLTAQIDATSHDTLEIGNVVFGYMDQFSGNPQRGKELFVVFLNCFNPVLHPLQDYFSSYDTGQSVSGRNRTRRKTTWHTRKENLDCLSWPVWGLNLHQTQRCDDRVIKKLDSSATGTAILVADCCPFDVASNHYTSLCNASCDIASICAERTMGV